MFVGTGVGFSVLFCTAQVVRDHLLTGMLVKIVTVKAVLDVANHLLARTLLWVWWRGEEVTSRCFPSLIYSVNGLRMILSLERGTETTWRIG
jgi:hypothetical protein